MQATVHIWHTNCEIQTPHRQTSPSSGKSRSWNDNDILGHLSHQQNPSPLREFRDGQGKLYNRTQTQEV